MHRSIRCVVGGYHGGTLAHRSYPRSYVYVCRYILLMSIYILGTLAIHLLSTSTVYVCASNFKHIFNVHTALCAIYTPARTR